MVCRFKGARKGLTYLNVRVFIRVIESQLYVKMCISCRVNTTSTRFASDLDLIRLSVVATGRLSVVATGRLFFHSELSCYLCNLF